MKKNKIMLVAASALLLASCGGGGGGRPTFGDNEYPVVEVGTSSAATQLLFLQSSRVCRMCKSARRWVDSLPRFLLKKVRT